MDLLNPIPPAPVWLDWIIPGILVALGWVGGYVMRALRERAAVEEARTVQWDEMERALRN